MSKYLCQYEAVLGERTAYGQVARTGPIANVLQSVDELLALDFGSERPDCLTLIITKVTDHVEVS